jgi:hypothetical protein
MTSNNVRRMMMERVVHPAAWRCGTYCFDGTDATPRIVSVDTPLTDGEENFYGNYSK